MNSKGRRKENAVVLNKPVDRGIRVYAMHDTGQTGCYNSVSQRYRVTVCGIKVIIKLLVSTTLEIGPKSRMKKN